MKYFTDSSAFIAFEDQKDFNHSEARRFMMQLQTGDRLITSNYILDETITRLRFVVGHHYAVRFAETIQKSRLTEIIYLDKDLEKRAVEILKKYRDLKLSFTDCTSIAIFQQHRLDAFFGFDADFKQAGFLLLPLKN